MNEKKFMKKTCGIAKAVVKKTQEIFEVSQLKIKMIQIKNKIERKYVKIGYFVYNKQKNNGLKDLKEELEKEKFKDFCKEIDELYVDLKKLEVEYAEIKSCIKKEQNNCLKKCGCEQKEEKKENYVKENENFEDEKTLITKEDEFEF